MSATCKGYADKDKSMLVLIFAPAKDWSGRSDEDITEATLDELERLFPGEINAAKKSKEEASKFAKMVKYHVAKTPRSVYKAVAGTWDIRAKNLLSTTFFSPAASPKQKYLASMEGALFSGKLAVDQVCLASQSNLIQKVKKDGLISETTVVKGLNFRCVRSSLDSLFDPWVNIIALGPAVDA